MIRFGAIALCLCLANPPADAQTKKGAKSATARKAAPKAPRDDDDRYSFRDAEARLIQDYYRPGAGHPPPGLAKKGSLPPGLERQLKRNGALPPGIEEHLEDLPEDLSRQLPPPPDGCRRAVVGFSVLLLRSEPNLVADLLPLQR